MAQARHVSQCEEGGNWHVKGPKYFGGLGWLNATWVKFRLPAFAHRMDYAPPWQQAIALGRFAANYYMPDLNGTCAGY